MKKVLIGIVSALAIFALAAPAPAVMKLTSQGYMEVNGIYISNNPAEGSNANDWYNMEMIVEPILHINDKVRIHSQVRIMERNWSGTTAGENYTNIPDNEGGLSKRYNVFDNEQNNFWVEKLYLSFPLIGGHLYVGRMSGGSYGYAWGDNETNADRIKWAGKVGIVTLVGVYEKSAELDGGQQAPRVGNLAGDPSWDTSDNDTDAYGVGWVVPLGKYGLYRGLSYNVRDGNPKGKRGITDGEPNWTYLWWTDVGLKFGMLQIDLALDFGYREDKGVQVAPGNTEDVTYTQWTFWGEVGVTPGPFEIFGGVFWLQGEDEENADEDERIGSFWNVGADYQPSLLLFSEDMGLLYAFRGVGNGTVGTSGIREVHVRAGYKLTETMKLTAMGQYVELDEMQINDVDEEIGMEFDLGFAWKFMPNITYTIEGGYFMPGDYFKDTFGEDDEVYGVRNTIRVEW